MNGTSSLVPVISARRISVSATMAKLFIALLVLVVVIAEALGLCPNDKCGRGKHGRHQSLCNYPCNYYYTCRGSKPYYSHCNDRHYCVRRGRCGPCGDSCEGKCNGRYQSVQKPRPSYYTCENGQLYYQTCQPYQVFNPWTKKCECFEGVCLHGNGFRPSFCRPGWRVYCRHGYPKFYTRCERRNPYVCCRDNRCMSTCRRRRSSGCCDE